MRKWTSHLNCGKPSKLYSHPNRPVYRVGMLCVYQVQCLAFSDSWTKRYWESLISHFLFIIAYTAPYHSLASLIAGDSLVSIAATFINQLPGIESQTYIWPIQHIMCSILLWLLKLFLISFLNSSDLLLQIKI